MGIFFSSSSCFLVCLCKRRRLGGVRSIVWGNWFWEMMAKAPGSVEFLMGWYNGNLNCRDRCIIIKNS